MHLETEVLKKRSCNRCRWRRNIIASVPSVSSFLGAGAAEALPRRARGAKGAGVFFCLPLCLRLAPTARVQRQAARTFVKRHARQSAWLSLRAWHRLTPV